MDEQQQWYVTVAGSAVGPVSTDLVLRGIKHKKIATEAYVCIVGADEWQALTDVPEFHGALKEHGLLPEVADTLTNADEDDESDATAPFSNRPSMPMPPIVDEQSAAPEPAHDEQSEITQVVALLHSRPGHEVAIHEATEDTAHYESGEPHNGKHVDVPLLSRPPMHSIDIDVDFSHDEPHEPAPAIDWNRGFADYFLVDAEVTLPDQDVLLRSLTSTPHETFVHDEAMWNLALCLAFGSNAVASVAADVFFDVVMAHQLHDRIEWMARTLLSRGFMPSGIPHPAGNMGIGRLRQACPPELLMQLESQLGM